MVGSSVEVEATGLFNGSLADGKSSDRLTMAAVMSFDPNSVPAEEVPPVVESNGEVGGTKREIILGRNVHTMSLEVTEPEADDESTGDKDAYMASVLARYRKILLERTKHHLGIIVLVFSFLICV